MMKIRMSVCVKSVITVIFSVFLAIPAMANVQGGLTVFTFSSDSNIFSAEGLVHPEALIGDYEHDIRTAGPARYLLGFDIDTYDGIKGEESIVSLMGVRVVCNQISQAFMPDVGVFVGTDGSIFGKLGFISTFLLSQNLTAYINPELLFGFGAESQDDFLINGLAGAQFKLGESNSVGLRIERDGFGDISRRGVYVTDTFIFGNPLDLFIGEKCEGDDECEPVVKLGIAFPF